MVESTKRIAVLTMTLWTILIDKKAQAELSKIDKPARVKIIELIDSLERSDPKLKGKALTANKSGLWRYRVGDYRVIAKIESMIVTITIVKVGHRSKVYD